MWKQLSFQIQGAPFLLVALHVNDCLISQLEAILAFANHGQGELTKQSNLTGKELELPGCGSHFTSIPKGPRSWDPRAIRGRTKDLIHNLSKKPGSLGSATRICLPLILWNNVNGGVPSAPFKSQHLKCAGSPFPLTSPSRHVSTVVFSAVRAASRELPNEFNGQCYYYLVN